MKNVLKWLLPALLLAVIIISASVLYNKFSEDYGGGNLIENTETKAAETTVETVAPDTTAEKTVSEAQTEASEEQETVLSAPDFTVLDYEGNEVKLSDYRGKPVVLNFWATWCYYCTLEMPDFDEAAKTYPEVQFLMVNATDGVRETMESAKQYVEEEGYQFDVFFDTQSEAVYAYYVTAFPTTYFIDSNGNLVAHGSGMLNYETIEKGIKMITD